MMPFSPRSPNRRMVLVGPELAGDLPMTAMSTPDLRVHSALESCAGTLRKIADYRPDESLQRRLDDLGERKEFLAQVEHEELLALVEFTQRRANESLEARLALSRLREAFPDALAVR